MRLPIALAALLAAAAPLAAQNGPLAAPPAPSTPGPTVADSAPDTRGFSFYDRGPYRAAVPRPEQILGYGVGDINTQFALQERTLLAIADAAKDRVRVEVIGATSERRTMRLYLVSNAQWFLRVGVFAYFVLGRLAGHDPSFRDPFLAFWTFGCYLVPLVVLECYLHAKQRGSALARYAVAAGLAALTLAMLAGMVAFGAFSLLIVSGKPISI